MTSFIFNTASNLYSSVSAQSSEVIKTLSDRSELVKNLSDRVEAAKEMVSHKVVETKSMVVSRVENTKTLVASKVENTKSMVVSRVESAKNSPLYTNGTQMVLHPLQSLTQMTVLAKQLVAEKIETSSSSTKTFVSQKVETAKHFAESTSVGKYVANPVQTFNETLNLAKSVVYTRVESARKTVTPRVEAARAIVSSRVVPRVEAARVIVTSRIELAKSTVVSPTLVLVRSRFDDAKTLVSPKIDVVKSEFAKLREVVQQRTVKLSESPRVQNVLHLVESASAMSAKYVDLNAYKTFVNEKTHMYVEAAKSNRVVVLAFYPLEQVMHVFSSFLTPSFPASALSEPMITEVEEAEVAAQ
eukprot:GILI01005915.1.p1 GENE.GILI01005915.1~~GILI01005915.1.p1  ORF type:complete len:358 (+),score=134.20 GILI01005915.1:112-1185(+)